MQRIINQVRDLELIEKELSEAAVGMLALALDDEKTIQFPTTFLYRDKNIYIFFSSADEFYQAIKYNSSASFSIIKEEKIKKSKSTDFIPSYRFFSITLKGLVRQVDEEKMLSTLRQEYLLKYSKKVDESSKKIPWLEAAIIMDSAEIHAQEEIGG